MHLNHLTIENIGPFRGIQKISFACSRQRPINVIVGPNGSGKTVLCKAIAWALGQYDPNQDPHYSRYWEHRGTLSASVTLSFTLGGHNYVVSRRQLEVRGSRRKVESQLKVQPNSGQAWNFVDNPDQHLQGLFPQEVGAAFLDFDGDRMFLKEAHNKFKMPEFIAWVDQRIERPDTCIFGGNKGHLALNIREILGEKSSHFGAGEVTLAALFVRALLREWIVTADSLPFNWQHLLGESLPWLLDCPFVALDSVYRGVAAEILLRSESQVVLLSTTTDLQAPVENILSPKVGCISVLNVGHNLFGGPTDWIFGKTLVLTRDDESNFSAIVSV